MYVLLQCTYGAAGPAVLHGAEVHTKNLPWGLYCLTGEWRKKETFEKQRDLPCKVVRGIGPRTDRGAPGSLGGAPGYTKYIGFSNLMCCKSYR